MLQLRQARGEHAEQVGWRVGHGGCGAPSRNGSHEGAAGCGCLAEGREQHGDVYGDVGRWTNSNKLTIFYPNKLKNSRLNDFSGGRFSFFA